MEKEGGTNVSGLRIAYSVEIQCHCGSFEWIASDVTSFYTIALSLHRLYGSCIESLSFKTRVAMMKARRGSWWKRQRDHSQVVSSQTSYSLSLITM